VFEATAKIVLESTLSFLFISRTPYPFEKIMESLLKIAKASPGIFHSSADF